MSCAVWGRSDVNVSEWILNVEIYKRVTRARAKERETDYQLAVQISGNSTTINKLHAERF
jgi:hypothetical protein